MGAYGTPETDKKLLDLAQEILDLEKDGKYEEAIKKNDEFISNLDILDSQTESGTIQKAVYRSELRDRKLRRSIMETNLKQQNLENRLDNFSVKIQELERIIKAKSEFR